MIEASFSPFHLLPALLARDSSFAASIGSQPLVRSSALELVDEGSTGLLDRHLVWHRLYYPDIPNLIDLRNEVESLERGRVERPSALFLLNLLYDLALDVPSAQLTSHRTLQPAVRALLFHTGQQVLFSLSRTNWTVLALVLASQYRPLVFTSSQTAAAPAVKSVTCSLLAKQVCVELGYDTAAARLTEALHRFGTDDEVLRKPMFQCLHWIRLSIAHETISNSLMQRAFEFQHADASAQEAVEALVLAMVLGRMPVELILPHSTNYGQMQVLHMLTELSDSWRDLRRLGQIINAHEAFINQEQAAIQNALEAQYCSPEMGYAVMHLAAADLRLQHNVRLSMPLMRYLLTSELMMQGVKGCALFFAVMNGAHSASHHLPIQADQAMGVSNDIIHQLTAHTEDDPDRPCHRKFLEQYGRTRIDELELDLANFVTAADTLTLNGIPFVAPLHQWTTRMLYTCKDITEQQAARLKGWGGLHDRIDIQTILFLQLARSLEAMSATAGTAAAMSQGCILTATAKLIKSLHGILMGFKMTVTMMQKRSPGAGTGVGFSGSRSGKTSVVPATTTSVEVVGGTGASAEKGAESVSEDLFAHWENWPQFDPADFSDLFGDVFDAQAQEEL
ncbi:uncharacterized protein LTR77_009589 [Saxophila tyrrhenica]|uniref:Uncharacterized protein n=1 Tax=Saxophila tyrrhenica TaxID=1690608 RepID=A0AAV9P1H4_9PEZI|nr:hypothetical protein LTR77_009589 [Saxophila tyrrhenica]